jgi:integrase
MCYQILKSILDGAVASRLIAESPCKRIVLPRVPNRENLYLTAEEVERLAAVVDPHFQALVYTAVYLGCRWGELVGLKRDRLDLLRRQVRIVGTLEEIRGVPEYVEEARSTRPGRMWPRCGLPVARRSFRCRSGEEKPGSDLHKQSVGAAGIEPVASAV